MSNQSSYWLAMIAVAAYTALWWFTSLTPKTRFNEISENGLVPIYNWLHIFSSALEITDSKEDAMKIWTEFERQDLQAKEWLEKHAGSIARSKYVSGRPDLVHYVVPGNAESERLQIVRTALAHIDIRARNIDDMMQSDKWIEPTKSKWSVWQRVSLFEPKIGEPTSESQ